VFQVVIDCFVSAQKQNTTDLYKHITQSNIMTMKNLSFGILRRVALVRTDVSEELSASFIKVATIDELGTTLAIISSQRASVVSYS
jgi:hypothetical protein